MRWLVVVHPGSMFGSAEHSLGKLAAREARESVFEEIEEHAGKGPIAIINGFFSEEIGPVSTQRISDAMKASADAGFPALNIWGCDNLSEPLSKWGPFDETYRHQSLAAEALAGRVRPGDEVVVTGAWHDPSGASGCVTGVAERISECTTGVLVIVSETAIIHPDDVLENDADLAL